jgi:hypothetical protein
LRLPHFVDNLLTDGGEVVGLTHGLPFTPRNISWYSFLLEAGSTPRAIMWLEGLGRLKNPMTSSGNEPATPATRLRTSKSLYNYGILVTLLNILRLFFL